MANMQCKRQLAFLPIYSLLTFYAAFREHIVFMFKFCKYPHTCCRGLHFNQTVSKRPNALLKNFFTLKSWEFQALPDGKRS